MFFWFSPNPVHPVATPNRVVSNHLGIQMPMGALDESTPVYEEGVPLGVVGESSLLEGTPPFYITG